MKKDFRRFTGAAVTAGFTLAFAACSYDPYYSPTAISGTYSTRSAPPRAAYGHGYGYGSSSFSTSVFIGTGNPQWGYDPNCYSYYDYRRRCYYDPYLNGYYPIGYRPPVVYGVPHPYGWQQGDSYCRPPSRVTNVTVINYRNRADSYRNSSYNWAKQVRTQPYDTYQGPQNYQTQGPRDSQNRDEPQNPYHRPNYDQGPGENNYRRNSASPNPYAVPGGQNPASHSRPSNHNPSPADTNIPVNHPEPRSEPNDSGNPHNSPGRQVPQDDRRTDPIGNQTPAPAPAPAPTPAPAPVAAAPAESVESQ